MAAEVVSDACGALVLFSVLWDMAPPVGLMLLGPWPLWVCAAPKSPLLTQPHLAVGGAGCPPDTS